MTGALLALSLLAAPTGSAEATNLSWRGAAPSIAAWTGRATTSACSGGPVALPAYPRLMAFRLLERYFKDKSTGLDVFKQYDICHGASGRSDLLRRVHPGIIEIPHRSFGLVPRPCRQ